ncbi:MAG: hypothetical protein K6G62_03590 [Eubacterium sp.]|nr:hypothetical protein [Eubacterium sp.]
MKNVRTNWRMSFVGIGVERMQRMIITQEHEIEIDETKYVPKMKIRKYYAKPPKITEALLIDFEDENVEVQKTITGTTLFNHKCYCMSKETITDGIGLFDRNKIVEVQHISDDKELDLWLLVKFYNLEGHKIEFIVDPRDINNPISNILKWLQKEYEEFVELQEFVKDFA